MRLCGQRVSGTPVFQRLQGQQECVQTLRHEPGVEGGEHKDEGQSGMTESEILI